MEEITSLLKKLDNSNLKSGPCGIVTVKNMLTLFLLKFRSIFMVFFRMEEIQHDEETIFNRASFAKLKQSEAGFRLENFEFLH